MSLQEIASELASPDWECRRHALQKLPVLFGASTNREALVQVFEETCLQRFSKQLEPLRSTLFLEACTTIESLLDFVRSDVFLAAILPPLCLALANTKKVISDKAHECSLAVTKSLPPEQLLPLWTDFYKDKREKVRARVANYVKLCLDKASDEIKNAEWFPILSKEIVTRISDSNPEVRSLSRDSFQCINQRWPEVADKLVEDMNLTTKKQVEYIIQRNRASASAPDDSNKKNDLKLVVSVPPKEQEISANLSVVRTTNLSKSPETLLDPLAKATPSFADILSDMSPLSSPERDGRLDSLDNLIDPGNCPPIKSIMQLIDQAVSPTEKEVRSLPNPGLSPCKPSGCDGFDAAGFKLLARLFNDSDGPLETDDADPMPTHSKLEVEQTEKPAQPELTEHPKPEALVILSEPPKSEASILQLAPVQYPAQMRTSMDITERDETSESSDDKYQEMEEERNRLEQEHFLSTFRFGFLPMLSPVREASVESSPISVECPLDFSIDSAAMKRISEGRDIDASLNSSDLSGSQYINDVAKTLMFSLDSGSFSVHESFEFDEAISSLMDPAFGSLPMSPIAKAPASDESDSTVPQKYTTLAADTSDSSFEVEEAVSTSTNLQELEEEPFEFDLSFEDIDQNSTGELANSFFSDHGFLFGSSADNSVDMDRAGAKSPKFTSSRFDILQKLDEGLDLGIDFSNFQFPDSFDESISEIEKVSQASFDEDEKAMELVEEGDVAGECDEHDGLLEAASFDVDALGEEISFDLDVFEPSEQAKSSEAEQSANPVPVEELSPVETLAAQANIDSAFETAQPDILADMEPPSEEQVETIAESPEDPEPDVQHIAPIDTIESASVIEQSAPQLEETIEPEISPIEHIPFEPEASIEEAHIEAIIEPAVKNALVSGEETIEPEILATTKPAIEEPEALAEKAVELGIEAVIEPEIEPAEEVIEPEFEVIELEVEAVIEIGAAVEFEVDAPVDPEARSEIDSIEHETEEIVEPALEAGEPETVEDEVEVVVEPEVEAAVEPQISPEEPVEPEIKTIVKSEFDAVEPEIEAFEPEGALIIEPEVEEAALELEIETPVLAPMEPEVEPKEPEIETVDPEVMNPEIEAPSEIERIEPDPQEQVEAASLAEPSSVSHHSVEPETSVVEAAIEPEVMATIEPEVALPEIEEAVEPEITEGVEFAEPEAEAEAALESEVEAVEPEIEAITANLDVEAAMEPDVELDIEAVEHEMELAIVEATAEPEIEATSNLETETAIEPKVEAPIELEVEPEVIMIEPEVEAAPEPEPEPEPEVEATMPEAETIAIEVEETVEPEYSIIELEAPETEEEAQDANKQPEEDQGRTVARRLPLAGWSLAVSRKLKQGSDVERRILTRKQRQAQSERVAEKIPEMVETSEPKEPIQDEKPKQTQRRRIRIQNPLYVSANLKETNKTPSPLALRTRGIKRTRTPASAYMFTASLPPIPMQQPGSENTNTNANIQQQPQQAAQNKKPGFNPLGKMANLKRAAILKPVPAVSSRTRKSQHSEMEEPSFRAIATTKPRKDQPATKRLRM